MLYCVGRRGGVGFCKIVLARGGKIVEVVRVVLGIAYILVVLVLGLIGGTIAILKPSRRGATGELLVRSHVRRLDPEVAAKRESSATRPRGHTARSVFDALLALQRELCHGL